MDALDLDIMTAPTGAFDLLSSGFFAGERMEQLERVCFDYWVSWKGGMRWESALPDHDLRWIEDLPRTLPSVRADYLDTWASLRLN